MECSGFRGVRGTSTPYLLLTASRKPYTRARNLPNCHTTARASGQVINLLISLAILPVSRSSIWHFAMGVSFDTTLWFHRTLGFAIVVLATIHLTLWCLVFYNRSANASDFPGFGQDAAFPSYVFMVECSRLPNPSHHFSSFPTTVTSSTRETGLIIRITSQSHS